MFRFPFRLLCRLPFHRRHLHSTTTQPLQLPLSHPIYLIWGSNTAVGKTLVSAGIAASHILFSPALFHYIKPVQTGFPIDSDSRFVFNKVSQLFLRRNPSFSLFASNLILNASGPASNAAGEAESCAREISVLNWREEKKLVGEGNGSSELICKTMYAWEEAVSPHLAAERESGTVENSVVLETLHRCFSDVLEDGAGKGKSEVLCVVETAGGVASPGPSGSLQCDLYRYCFISIFLKVYTDSTMMKKSGNVGMAKICGLYHFFSEDDPNGFLN